MTTPHLTFFCELEAQALAAMFHDPRVPEQLSAIGASVSMALRDLSLERAGVVHALNQAGIPVIAWLVVPPEQGYYLNLDNASQAEAAYAGFKAWSAEHALQWGGVGLGIEPNLRDLDRLEQAPWETAVAWLRALPDAGRLRRGMAQYRDLLAQIRADGYLVESYVLPVIIDERWAGSTLVERLFGIMDLPADREVLVLYTTLWGGAGALWSYGASCGGIAVGSTGGGIKNLPALSWAEVERDLLLAHCWTDDIYLFSLEGCVQQGYLERLHDFDWARTVAAPFGPARQIEALRAGLRAVLWTSEHPAILLALPALLALMQLSRRRKPAL